MRLRDFAPRADQARDRVGIRAEGRDLGVVGRIGSEPDRAEHAFVQLDVHEQQAARRDRGGDADERARLVGRDEERARDGEPSERVEEESSNLGGAFA